MENDKWYVIAMYMLLYSFIFLHLTRGFTHGVRTCIVLKKFIAVYISINLFTLLLQYQSFEQLSFYTLKMDLLFLNVICTSFAVSV